jgi:hypothetical protein
MPVLSVARYLAANEFSALELFAERRFHYQCGGLIFSRARPDKRYKRSMRRRQSWASAEYLQYFIRDFR